MLCVSCPIFYAAWAVYQEESLPKQKEQSAWADFVDLEGISSEDYMYDFEIEAERKAQEEELRSNCRSLGILPKDSIKEIIQVSSMDEKG